MNQEHIGTVTQQFRNEPNHLRAILDVIADGIVVTDEHGITLMHNPAAIQLFGLAEGELTGRDIRELLTTPIEGEIDHCLARGANRHSEPDGPARVVLEVNGKTSGGAILSLELTVSPVAFENRFQFVFVFRDMTELRRDQTAHYEREYFLATIADQMPGMIGYWTRQLRCGFANREYLAWFGRDPEQLKGIHIRDLMGEDLFKKNECFILAALRGESQQFERTLTKANGEIGFTLARYVPHVRNGEVQGFFVLVSDITAIKTAHEKLMQAEAYNRAMISAVPDMMLTLNCDGDILAIHDPNPNLLTYPLNADQSLTIFNILPQLAAEKIINVVQQTSGSSQVQELTCSFNRAGEGERHYEVSIATGGADRSIAILRDVTDRELDRRSREFYTAQLSQQLRLSESELRDREQALALAANAANLGAWTLHLTENTFSPSEQWRALFGFPIGEPLDADAKFLRVHPEELASARQALAVAIAGSGIYEHSYRIVLPGGQLRWIFSQGRVEFDEHGTAILLRAVSVDITRRKLDELELEKKRKEITHLARVAVLGELSGALAHELNQPLTSILSNAQAAQRFLKMDQIDLDVVRDILVDIVNEDKRASEVIVRLRQLFRQGPPTQQRFPVNQLAMEVSRILRNDLISQNVTLQLELTEDTLLIDADQVQLQQVLINLVMNACDALVSVPHSERIVILRCARTDNETVQMSVVDRGPGMAADVLEHIFEPFYSTKERGMGLGLSICRNIINVNGGILWAVNNPGGGASLHFTLPLAGLMP